MSAKTRRWVNPLVEHTALRYGVYTGGNVFLLVMVALFLWGTAIRYGAYRHAVAVVEMLPPPERPDMRVLLRLVPNDITAFGATSLAELAALRLQVLALLALLLLHLADGVAAALRPTTRWNSPFHDELRVVPLGMKQIHFGLMDWPLVKTSLVYLTCVLLLVVVPAREPTLELLQYLGLPAYVSARSLLIHSNHVFALIAISLLPVSWVVYTVLCLFRVQGLRILLCPVTLILLAGGVAMWFPMMVDLKKSLYDAYPVIWGGIFFVRIVLAGFVAAVLASVARRDYFRALKERQ